MEASEAGTLVKADPTRLDLGIHREPEVVLDEARRAATALKAVIDAKPEAKKVIFNGETYLEFEDWQTVGRFYGITPRVIRTQHVEYGDVRGWEAVADAVHVATGQVVASAEAMCLNDEDKWRARPKYEWHYLKRSGGTSAEDPGRDELIWEDGRGGKKRPKKQRVCVGEEAVPLFQLRSMAQTRACAKAMRNALAWVVVLAGYRPTPAEELPSRQDDGDPAQNGGATPPSREEPQGTTGDPLISEPQAKRLYAIARGSGWSDDQLHDLLAGFRFSSSKEITRARYDEIVELAKRGPAKP